MDSRHKQALSLPCPECNVKAYSSCVYLWPTGMDHLDPRPNSTVPVRLTDSVLHLLWSRSVAIRRQIVIAGMPMNRSHNGRLRALYEREQWNAVRDERHKLREWLLAFGDIFEMGQPTSS